jgi:deoxyribodipyrimidine photo-lyase
MQRSLYWFTKDLRINDNTALNLASQSESLLCVFVVDKRWFSATNYQSVPLGIKRWQFLQACLVDLEQSLANLGQKLHVLYGETSFCLKTLCNAYGITDLIYTDLPGSYEQDITNNLKQQLPAITHHSIEQFTLFSSDILPFDQSIFPVSFSKFRKLVKNVSVPKPYQLSSRIPKQPTLKQSENLTKIITSAKNKPNWLPIVNCLNDFLLTTPFKGGETAALNRLNNYFNSALPASYKQVRNSLSGWENSSKLSPWLGYGCMSARQVHENIRHFESTKTKNESTEWLYVELLWREYFQWVHFAVGVKTYQFKGLNDYPPLTSFYPERFAKWCLGNTPYPLVNACMRELKQTGYLSNRGRQIVASCLVNELAVDWRYGAAWFEEWLIDYDAAVNWGNWQYIAGVGVDPQGGRHFNLTKQTQLFDGDGSYQKTWNTLDAQHTQHLDSVDFVDWPVTSTPDH